MLSQGTTIPEYGSESIDSKIGAIILKYYHETNSKILSLCQIKKNYLSEGASWK